MCLDLCTILRLVLHGRVALNHASARRITARKVGAQHKNRKRDTALPQLLNGTDQRLDAE